MQFHSHLEKVKPKYNIYNNIYKEMNPVLLWYILPLLHPGDQDSVCGGVYGLFAACVWNEVMTILSIKQTP